MLEQFTKNFLNVTHSGKSSQLGFKELFNSSDFDSLPVISFVSSNALVTKKSSRKKYGSPCWDQFENLLTRLPNSR
jgi:hypothetical protein